MLNKIILLLLVCMFGSPIVYGYYQAAGPIYYSANSGYSSRPKTYRAVYSAYVQPQVYYDDNNYYDNVNQFKAMYYEPPTNVPSNNNNNDNEVTIEFEYADQNINNQHTVLLTPKANVTTSNNANTNNNSLGSNMLSTNTTVTINSTTVRSNQTTTSGMPTHYSTNSTYVLNRNQRNETTISRNNTNPISRTNTTKPINETKPVGVEPTSPRGSANNNINVNLLQSTLSIPILGLAFVTLIV